MSRSRESIIDEIALREASLADAEREREIGELSDEEFERIASKENDSIAQLHRELSATPEAEVTPRRRRRRWQLVVAGLCFASAAAVTLVSAVSTRQPGDSATGTISSSDQAMIRRLLAEGEVDIANGKIAAALAAYDAVLMIDDSNVTALTQSGWFYFSSGSDEGNAASVSKGTARLRRAVSLDSASPSAQLYYAIAALSIPGNRSIAMKHMKAFLSLHPSNALLSVAAPYRRQLGL